MISEFELLTVSCQIRHELDIRLELRICTTHQGLYYGGTVHALATFDKEIEHRLTEWWGLICIERIEAFVDEPWCEHD